MIAPVPISERLHAYICERTGLPLHVVQTVLLATDRFFREQHPALAADAEAAVARAENLS